MVIDLGTGDGRAVVARTSAEPGSFVIGIDANAAAMAEASRRARRSRSGGNGANALFLVEAVEALPGHLAGAAGLVTVTMPWGSLLRGILGLDDDALRGVASVVGPIGHVEILASVVPADRVAGLDALDDRAAAGIAAAWRALGFVLGSMRPATRDDVLATRSSWARRLRDRPVWRIALERADR